MKTTFGLFETAKEANDALLELEEMGIAAHDISVVAQAEVLKHEEHSETAEDAGKGAGIGGLVGLVAGIAPIALPGIGPIIGAGTIISGALGGAGIGAAVGGLVGAFREMMGHGHDDLAHRYEEGVSHGHIMLAVRTGDASAQDVADVMTRHQAHDVYIQESVPQPAH